MSAEEKLLEYIIKFKQVNGCSPTHADMKIGLDTNSSSWIEELLDRLEEKGYIERLSRRGIVVIKF